MSKNKTKRDQKRRKVHKVYRRPKRVQKGPTQNTLIRQLCLGQLSSANDSLKSPGLIHQASFLLFLKDAAGRESPFTESSLFFIPRLSRNHVRRTTDLLASGTRHTPQSVSQQDGGDIDVFGKALPRNTFSFQAKKTTALRSRDSVNSPQNILSSLFVVKIEINLQPTAERKVDFVREMSIKAKNT